MEKPLAAGQSGARIKSARPETEAPAPQSQDERARLAATTTLAAMLAAGMDILTRCQDQTKARRGGLGPVYAAAQLMHANAALAKALAQVGCVEARRRTIVEHIQTPAAQNPELNYAPPACHDEDTLNELERRIGEIAKANRHEQEKNEDQAIGSCI